MTRRAPGARIPLSPAELASEARWLLDGGLHVTMISKALDRSPAAISVAARRNGEPEVARVFDAYRSTEDRIQRPGRQAAAAAAYRARMKVAA